MLLLATETANRASGVVICGFPEQVVSLVWLWLTPIPLSAVSDNAAGKA